jgi:LEA14-like dessication related protein
MTKILPYFLLLALTACASLRELLNAENQPTFTVTSVQIQKITLETLTLQIHSKVKNPYPVSLPQSQAEMKILIEGTPFATLSNLDMGKLAASSTTPLPLEVKIKYSDLVEIYKKVPSKETLSVKIEGILKIPLPESLAFTGIKILEFPFVQEKQIPALLPTIVIRNFKILKPEPSLLGSSASTAVLQSAMTYMDSLLGGKKTTVQSAAEAGLESVDLNVDTEFEIVLTNQAAAKLTLLDLKYQLTLSGEKFLEGKPQNIVSKGNESILSVKTSFPLKSLSKGIASAIQKRTSPFQLKGVSGLQIPGIPEGILPFEYDKSGTFSW